MMTETSRQSQLEEATREAAIARSRWENAKTKKAQREAAEDLEFWTNKKAFLANVKL